MLAPLEYGVATTVGVPIDLATLRRTVGSFALREEPLALCLCAIFTTLVVHPCLLRVSQLVNFRSRSMQNASFHVWRG